MARNRAPEPDDSGFIEVARKAIERRRPQPGRRMPKAARPAPFTGVRAFVRRLAAAVGAGGARAARLLSNVWSALRRPVARWGRKHPRLVVLGGVWVFFVALGLVLPDETEPPELAEGSELATGPAPTSTPNELPEETVVTAFQISTRDYHAALEDAGLVTAADLPFWELRVATQPPVLRVRTPAFVVLTSVRLELEALYADVVVDYLLPLVPATPDEAVGQQDLLRAELVGYLRQLEESVPTDVPADDAVVRTPWFVMETFEPSNTGAVGVLISPTSDPQPAPQ